MTDTTKRDDAGLYQPSAAVAHKACAIAVQARVPLLVWGQPGTAKTAWLDSLAVTLRGHVETLYLAQVEPPDVAGHFAADLATKSTIRLLPDWAARLIEASTAGLLPMLFVDEASCAPPANWGAAMNIIMTGIVAGRSIPGLVVMAAANPIDQSAGGWDLPAPASNRFVHIGWPADVDSWVDGMVAGWERPSVAPLPQGWESSTAPRVAALFASFYRRNASLLQDCPADSKSAGLPWPSMRSATMAARLAAAAVASGEPLTGDVAFALIAGCIGQSTASTLVHWIKEQDLPDPEAVLADPSRHPLPKRGDQIQVTLDAIAGAALREHPDRVKRYAAAWVVVARVAKDHGEDVPLAAAALLAPRKPAGARVPPEAAALGKVLERAGIDLAQRGR